MNANHDFLKTLEKQTCRDDKDQRAKRVAMYREAFDFYLNAIKEAVDVKNADKWEFKCRSALNGEVFVQHMYELDACSDQGTIALFRFLGNLISDSMESADIGYFNLVEMQRHRSRFVYDWDELVDAGLESFLNEFERLDLVPYPTVTFRPEDADAPYSDGYKSIECVLTNAKKQTLSLQERLKEKVQEIVVRPGRKLLKYAALLTVAVVVGVVIGSSI